MEQVDEHFIDAVQNIEVANRSRDLGLPVKSALGLFDAQRRGASVPGPPASHPRWRCATH